MSMTSVANPKQPSLWQAFHRRFLAAHPSIVAAAERRQAELLAALSLTLIVIDSFYLILIFFIGQANLVSAASVLVEVFAFITYLMSRSKHYKQSAIVFIVGFSAAVYLASFVSRASNLSPIVAFSILFLMSNLLELRRMVVVVLSNVVIAIVVGLFFLPGLQGIETILFPVSILTLAAFNLLFAWHRESLQRLRLDELRASQRELERANQELLQAQREVNARFAELRLAADVGRAVSQVRNLDEMLTDAVERIRHRFDLYYVQVYLVNPAQTTLVLQAGTGEVGKQLLAHAHRLPLDANSINGRAALEKRSIVVPDTAASPTFKPNPLLPDTRSEMAVPLIVGERVVGVLDMQSAQPNALNPDALPAFEALAGQLAIAIQNANLLAEAESARAEAEKYARRLARQNWQEYLDAIHAPEQLGFVFEAGQFKALTEETNASTVEEQGLSAPVTIAGEPIGELMVETAEQQPNPLAAELVNIVARQVAQQIENLRLLESAERYRLEAEEASRRLTRQAWQDFVSARRGKMAFFYDLREVRPLESVSQTPQPGLTVPLKIRDTDVGSLTVMDVTADEGEAAELVNAVAERLSVHIENLRLSQQTFERAQREQALRRITSAVRGSTDPAVILRTAARELGNIFGRQTVVYLKTKSEAESTEDQNAAVAEVSNPNGGNA
ncbi:MAG: GAF domain-containing protein [Anaerolineales bacterium]